MNDLIVDARLALEAGDAASAVSYMEQAFQKDADHREVRTLLSKSLLARDSIGALDVQELAVFAAGTVPTNGVPSFEAGSDLKCTFMPTEVATTAIDLTEASSYQRIEPYLNNLRRIETLVDIEPGNVSNSYEALVLADAMQMLSLAKVAIAIVELQKTAEATEATLHRLPDTHVGYCANTVEELQIMTNHVACQTEPDLQRAAESIHQRLQLLRAPTSSAAGDLLEASDAAKEAIVGLVTGTCPAG